MIRKKADEMNLNEKGQALVEFVLILPIFLFMIFAMVDVGMIIYSKHKLESNSNDIIEMLDNGEDIVTITSRYDDDFKNLQITVTNEGKYTNVTIKNDFNLITPGLNYLFHNPYIIKVERSILSAS